MVIIRRRGVVSDLLITFQYQQFSGFIVGMALVVPSYKEEGSNLQNIFCVYVISELSPSSEVNIQLKHCQSISFCKRNLQDGRDVRKQN